MKDVQSMRELKQSITANALAIAAAYRSLTILNPALAREAVKGVLDHISEVAGLDDDIEYDDSEFYDYDDGQQ